jgi:CDP-6-deoxy-D-xylo-4-hexulose-3-dehydrase
MEIKYPLSNDTWGSEEYAAIDAVLKSNRFTMGEKVAAAERAAAEEFGSKYAVMTSSGSTANLLAISAMVYSGRLEKGDEVLVPAVSWSTTYFPLEQLGLKMRLVDIDRETLNMDVEKAEQAVTERTRGVFAVNLLGNPNRFDELTAFCKKHGLILMEDNCESMGASYEGKQAGSFGVFGTFSTFFSHHLCTMEGGFVITDDEELYHYMLSARAHGWTRNLPENSSLHTKSADPFYESFCFVVPGFNLRPLEMEGALASEQLKRLAGFVAQRRKNAEYFKSTVGSDPRFYMQKETGRSSWFGFALLLREPDARMRDRVVSHLRERGIETRPIVAGNFARQPVFSRLDASISGELTGADYIHDNGFFVGNHSIDMREQIDWLGKALGEI